MTTTLRRKLDEAGFQSTRIQMADASFLYLGIERADALRKYPEAWKATDYVAAHQYDFQQFLANPDMYDERLRAMHRPLTASPSWPPRFASTILIIRRTHIVWHSQSGSSITRI